MLTDNSGCPLIPVAKISVGNLQQDGDGSCSSAEFSLVNDSECKPKVRIEGQGLGTEIFVKGEVDLQFEVATTGDHENKQPHVPIGISFEEELLPGNDKQPGPKRDKADLRDPLGLRAFPERRLVSAGGTTLLIVRDKCFVEGCFKFSLIIQKVGMKKPIIIDPKIRNVPM